VREKVLLVNTDNY